MKRLFDITMATVGLIIFAPLMLLIAVIIKLSSAGPILFRQTRVGRDFRPFEIYKFRSMVQDAPSKGAQITFGKDPRITPIGHLLRATKLDELPQLMNVLKGEMSFVGPRPEVPRYVEMFRDDFAQILRVRPGITDPASIRFRDEAAILGAAEDPEREYVENVLPAKIEIAKSYVQQSSLMFDIALIVKTCMKLAADRVARPAAC